MFIFKEDDIANRDIPVISTGVNYDYVLLLKLCDDKYIVTKKSIQRSMNLLQRIIDFVASDLCTVEDLMKLTIGLPKKSMNYSFCSLSSSYVMLPFLPDMSQNVTKDYIYDGGYSTDFIEPNYYDDIKVFHREFENYFKRRYRNLHIVDKERYEQKEKELLHKFQLRWENHKKYRYSQFLMRYIYALDYDTSVKGIDEDTTIVAYSHEKIGYKYGSRRYPFFQKQISDDIELSINTNFCYGDSSYFNVAIKYKGVTICPYSAWVRFYHARYNEIMYVTRQYNLTRENWERCFDFVSDFVNMSISDPDKFVRELIVKEIVNLRIGLDKIFNMPEREIKRRMTVQGQNAYSYLGIKNLSVANEADINEYNIQGKDMVFVWKMEKIAHAVHFIEGLKAFEDISDEIKNTVDYIIKKSLSIKDETCNKIMYLNSLLQKANDSLSEEQENKSQMCDLQKNLQKEFDRRNRAREKNMSREELYNQFVKEHSDFEDLNERIGISEKKIDSLRNDVRRYREYVSRLEDVEKSIQLLESKI